jgi:pimeloyl-ACP methyl ester carboxylesterase
MFRRVLILVLLCALPHARAEVRIESGEIGGALFQIVRPEAWKGDVWVEAHGLRPEGTPLSAVVPVASPFVRGLLEDGWLVATTSYRRNGIVFAEAADDVAALIAHIRSVHEPSGYVIVEGQSMGAAVVARLAERGEPPFHGAVACGAALEVRDPGEKEWTWSRRPSRPVVFLTNRSELRSPRAYVDAVRALETSDAVVPAFLTVDRDGHVNLNASERRHALDLLLTWIRTERRPEDGDATRPPDPGPRTAVLKEGEARVQVVELSRIYGNLTLDLQAADLAGLGLARGASFEIEGPAGRFRVLLGTSYGDVPKGEWVAFPTADGLLMVARNHAPAAATLGVTAEGVRLQVRPITSQPGG